MIRSVEAWILSWNEAGDSTFKFYLSEIALPLLQKGEVEIDFLKTVRDVVGCGFFLHAFFRGATCDRQPGAGQANPAAPPKRSVTASTKAVPSCQDWPNDFTGHIGEPVIAPLKPIGEALVIKAQLVE